MQNRPTMPSLNASVADELRQYLSGSNNPSKEVHAMAQMPWGQDWDDWQATKPGYNGPGHQLGYDPAKHEEGKGFLLQDGSVWTWPTRNLRPQHMEYSKRVQNIGAQVVPGTAFHIRTTSPYRGEIWQYGEGRDLSRDQRHQIRGADLRLDPYRLQSQTPAVQTDGFGHANNLVNKLTTKEPTSEWVSLGVKTADYYHLAPTQERDRIQQHGLQAANPYYKEDRWKPTPFKGWGPPEHLKDQPTGVYVGDEEQAQRMREDARRPLDMWLIPDSVKVLPNPSPGRDSYNTWYIPHNVDNPQLHSPYEETLPHETPVDEWQLRQDMRPYNTLQDLGNDEAFLKGFNPWGIGRPDRVWGGEYLPDNEHVGRVLPKISGMTLPQQQRLRKSLEQRFGPENTNTLYQFPDGWSIQHLPTWGEVGREGTMMHHCWGGLGDDYPHESYDDGTGLAVSLRDQNNWPHMSFYYDPNDKTPYGFGEHGGFEPDDESPHWDRIQQWMNDTGGNFTHPMQDYDNQSERTSASYQLETVNCPQCKTPFYANGWTGYTTLDGKKIGWQCPECKSDFKSVKSRPRVTQDQWVTSAIVHADNYTLDSRKWPDPTEPRSDDLPAPRGCTCKEGEKLTCPVHGMNATEPDYDNTWAQPQGQPVGYGLTDGPRSWQQAHSNVHTTETSEENKVYSSSHPDDDYWPVLAGLPSDNSQVNTDHHYRSGRETYLLDARPYPQQTEQNYPSEDQSQYHARHNQDNYGYWDCDSDYAYSSMYCGGDDRLDHESYFSPAHNNRTISSAHYVANDYVRPQLYSRNHTDSDTFCHQNSQTRPSSILQASQSEYPVQRQDDVRAERHYAFASDDSAYHTCPKQLPFGRNHRPDMWSSQYVLPSSIVTLSGEQDKPSIWYYPQDQPRSWQQAHSRLVTTQNIDSKPVPQGLGKEVKGGWQYDTANVYKANSRPEAAQRSQQHGDVTKGQQKGKPVTTNKTHDAKISDYFSAQRIAQEIVRLARR